jgi:hypothetical protein
MKPEPPSNNALKLFLAETHRMQDCGKCHSRLAVVVNYAHSQDVSEGLTCSPAGDVCLQDCGSKGAAKLYVSHVA